MSNLTNVDEISDYWVTLFIPTLMHPITHARILMQLGFEPMPPYLGHSILSTVGIGAQIYKYPSIFTYCKYLRDTVGIVGLFTRGLTPQIIYWNLSSTVSNFIVYKLSHERHLSDARHINIDSDFNEFIIEIRNLSIAHGVATVICHPFYVLMVRQIAEIMNGEAAEHKYMFSLILAILDDEGVLSFYNGLSSKLIGEVATIWLTAIFAYVFNKHVMKNRLAPDINYFTPALGAFLSSSLTYRFFLISTVMAISGSKIVGAIPFRSIFHCYSFLNNQNALNRGSSLFLRYKA